MRVPITWLRELVQVEPGVTGAQIASSLVRVGLEEEDIFGSGITGPLVVGQVRTATREEQKNGKTISWCTVDVGDANGTGELQGIVCGAPNVAADQWVVVVLPGAELPGGFAISARKTYGHTSAGMICSAQELGLGTDPRADEDGIIDLHEWFAGDEDALQTLTPGSDAISLLGLDREVIEINVTPDRGYAFSMRGVAREYALATGVSFTDPAGSHPSDQAAALAKKQRNEGSGFPVTIEDAALSACDRFTARIVRGIDPTASTPAWMATYLTEVGMRPISLAVDITNYVMMLLGQPTHAYDLAQVGDGLVVRRARSGEKLTTLDEVKRPLFDDDLVIADASGQALGLAGVMGGASSEVTDATRDVLIEAAHFDPTTIARASRRHRLTSEASKRFERGVDPAVTARASALVADLLVEFGGGTLDPGVTDIGSPAAPAPITLDPSLPTRLVGMDFPADEVVASLRAVGCEVIEGQTSLQVTPASWRPDLTNSPDLVEEVARIRGYEHIPSILPRATSGRGLSNQQRTRRAVAAVLAEQGLTEVLSYPFIRAELFDELGYDADDPRRLARAVVNPMQDEAPVLRTSLLDTLLETLRRNIARGTKDCAIYELGTVTRGSERAQSAPSPALDGRPDESVLEAILDAVPAQPAHVAIAAAGEIELAGPWGAARAVTAADVVTWVLSLGDALGLSLTLEAAELEPWHPGRCVRVSAEIDGEVHSIGHAGELHPKVISALGLPARTVAAELELDLISSAISRPAVATPLSTHPAAMSDLALVVDQSVSAARVESALREGAGELLESIRIFDRYVGDQVPAGQQSLAYRLTFRAPDRTLTTDEVSASRDAALAAASTAVGATIRA